MFLYKNYQELFDNSALFINDEKKENCDIDRNYEKMVKRIEVFVTINGERNGDNVIVIDKEQRFEDAAEMVVDIFKTKFKYFTDRVEITSVYPIPETEQCLHAVIKYA